MRSANHIVTLSVTLLFVVAVPGTRAEWPQHGVALSTAFGDQSKTQIISDGADGAIVVWQDARGVSGHDIYAQRVDAFGVPQWTANGVAICTAPDLQYGPQVVSDGAGGAIVTWYDFRSGAPDIYVQRVNPSGATLWTADGVAICTAIGNQQSPEMTSDGIGGAIVTWYDDRSGNGDIYVQRVNSSGNPQWTANGVAACTAAGTQDSPRIASDGASGAVLTWVDTRSGTADIYAQSVNFFGTPLWVSNGVAVCTAADSQSNPSIVSDGAGGTIVVWEDNRGGFGSNIYAQRLAPSGSADWNADGAFVCLAANDQVWPRLVSDGAGGAIITWQDFRNLNDDIYAGHLSASGARLWAPGGVAVCTAFSGQFRPELAAIGAGGAVITWMDNRKDTSAYDVYAQRFDASGSPQWPTNGVALSTEAGQCYDPKIVITGTEAGIAGGISCWEELRGDSVDIFSQRLELTHGYWGHPEPVVVAAADVPNDQGGQVAVNWTASGRDRVTPRTIGQYSIWRAVDPLGLRNLPSKDLLRTAVSDDPSGSPQRSSTDYYWELAGTQTALGWAGYSFSVPTRSDSVSGDPGTEFFLVAAHDEFDELVAFPSNSVSGHSVDNLAPAAPLALTATRAGPDVELSWNRVGVTDLRDYSLYRATSSGVTPVEINFLAASLDTAAVDLDAPQTDLYYIVTAFDVHENQSMPSNEALAPGGTGVPSLDDIHGLTLLPNRPNPFATRTELAIGLSESSDIVIEVYDVSGRRVRRLDLPQQPAGWARVSFDGRDDTGRRLSSGVYFYRVRSAGKTLAGEMVIAR